MSKREAVVAALGVAQTLAWASTYYLPAILAAPMARDLGVSVPTVFAAFSLSLVVAAFLGPHSGRAIDRWGGRPVLMATNVVFSAGLALLGSSQSVGMLFLAWAVLGIGMGSGLYEAAFAALVRLYGSAARKPITGITLLAGFASTVGWPLTAWLETNSGWREACYVWAGLHLLLGLPLNWSLPRAAALAESAAAPVAAQSAGVPLRSVVLLSFVFAATWFVSTAMAAHLPRLLQASGATSTAAVAVGALIGPAQVAARVLEFRFLSGVHPLLSARVAAAMHPVGAGVLALFGAPAAPVFGVLHGAGNGILTIAKGTLPLVLFGSLGYGHIQGVLMVPARLAQAFAPWLFGLALDSWGAGSLMLSAGIGMAAFAALLVLPTAAREPVQAGGRFKTPENAAPSPPKR
ncbi:MFS transporter [Ramlibacter tataouinensis]|uniref:MFS transporter n=1 Tax=Ramlibacter tataouinensis TaxID=94132 RepID=UPI0022F39E8C|nr:MFS transporter [Ramlibacter tataouinensis]WBY01747.1 MFS transporter [Ramlibacter tataouinensis]